MLDSRIESMLESLKAQIRKEINEVRSSILQKQQALSGEIASDYDGLSQEGVSEELVRNRAAGGRIEMKMGLFVMNITGFILILIGLGVLAWYNRNHINDYVKGSFFFLLGLLFGAAGEWIYRTGRTKIALGFLGAGIAVLYGADFYSYYLLQIISLVPALILSVLITVTALGLSLRYQSKIISSLSLTGGFLPFLSYAVTEGVAGSGVLIAMGYLFSLNLLNLALSYYKEWKITRFLSFILNVPAMIYLIIQSENDTVSLIYVLVTFLVFLITVLIRPFTVKGILKPADLILTGLNTVVSAVLVYSLFYQLKLTGFNGALAVGFSGVFTLLGLLIRRMNPDDRKAYGFFMLTALAFSLLVIPLQFGFEWLSTWWIIEGTLLTLYGRLKKEKGMEITGLIISGICLFLFFVYDLPVLAVQRNLIQFNFKFGALSLSLGVISIIPKILMQKNPDLRYRRFAELDQAVFYLFIFFNYFFLLFTAYHAVTQAVYQPLSLNSIAVRFFNLVIFTVISGGYGLLLRHWKLLRDRITSAAGIVFYLAADLAGLILLFQNRYLSEGFNASQPLRVTAVLLVLVINGLIIVNFYRLILNAFRNSRWNFELFPVFMTLLILVDLSSLLVRQFYFDQIGLMLNFIYLAAAVGSIVFGFIRQFRYIRYFGLGLTFLVLGKFFLYDLHHLDIGGRILSYIGFGVLLIAISFIYQQINHRLNRDKEKS
jgi:uncharacterized membrane protein